jgi:hypothetical protein
VGGLAPPVCGLFFDASRIREMDRKSAREMWGENHQVVENMMVIGKE